MRPTTLTRLLTGVVLLLAAVTFLTVSLRAPSFAFVRSSLAAAVEARCTKTGNAELIASSVEACRVPTARPSRGEAPRPPRLDGSLGPIATPGGALAVVTTSSRSREASRAPQSTWLRGSKSHSELMVFLN